MEEILACRSCLATDVKLFNMHKYELIKPFENLTGFQMSTLDGCPQEMCSYCAAMLLKCAKFQQKCRDAQQLLNYAVVGEQNMISNAYIRSINRQAHNLALPYTTTHNNVVIKQEELSDNDLTSLLHNIIEQSDVKVEENSDEEPLAKFVKKSKKRKRKNAVQAETNPEHNTDDKQITIKEELDLLPLHFDDCYNDDITVAEGQYDDDVTIKPELFCDDQIEVVTLTKEEQLQELQARKTSLNYINSFYKCEMCYKGFMVESTYKNHMDRHDPSCGSLCCDVCLLRFPSRRTLHQHSLAAHARTYTCRRCGHVCKAKSRAKEHYKWHQGVLYVCDICGAAFDKPTSHLTHLRTNHPSRHICPICGVSFVSEHGLKMHGRKAHRGGTEDMEPNLECKCVLCGIQFKNGDALAKHLSLADNDICDPTVRPCVFCGQNFLTEELLRKHALAHQNAERSYDCIECNKSFNSARYQAAHYRRVHSPRAPRDPPHPPANKMLPNAVCEICGKKCTSRATLVYHQRTHSGEKPYQCNECPKRFSILQRLQIHIRTHTGERPCQCPHCPKAFKHKAALNRHVRVHTGVKPYSCPHCGKSFSQSNTMKGHVRSVHLKLPSLYRRPGKRGDYSE